MHTMKLPEKTKYEHLLAGGYETLVEVPVVTGRAFSRTLEGRIACYDLRKPAESVIDISRCVCRSIAINS